MDKPIEWDKLWLKMAYTAALRSKDSSTKVGAVLVNQENHQISMGYNGFPAGMAETEALWQRPIKYFYVVHAEMNCIFNALEKVAGCTLYVTHKPCVNCAKHIAAVGIRKVIYVEDYKNTTEDTVTTDMVFVACGVQLTHLDLERCAYVDAIS